MSCNFLFCVAQNTSSSFCYLSPALPIIYVISLGRLFCDSFCAPLNSIYLARVKFCKPYLQMCSRNFNILFLLFCIILTRTLPSRLFKNTYLYFLIMFNITDKIIDAQLMRTRIQTAIFQTKM